VGFLDLAHGLAAVVGTAGGGISGSVRVSLAAVKALLDGADLCLGRGGFATGFDADELAAEGGLGGENGDGGAIAKHLDAAA